MLRFLLRLKPKGQSQQEFVRTLRLLAKSIGAESKNPKWTSYGALEMDVFAPGKSDFELLTRIVEPLSSVEFARDLNVAPEHKSDDELFKEAWGYFNSERYWECHEVLEGVWRVRTGEDKRYLQGLILVCAAFVHHQKGEDKVALGILGRASGQLTYSTRIYHGLDTARFAEDAASILKAGTFRNFKV